MRLSSTSSASVARREFAPLLPVSLSLTAYSRSKQRRYAEKILPIRRNGHLLLITLLLANMVVNEALPVISEPVLGGGFASVAISTVLIVM